jgi:hypothetical protein
VDEAGTRLSDAAPVALDIPLALKAMLHAAAQANNQRAALVSSGLKRGMAKVIVFSASARRIGMGTATSLPSEVGNDPSRGWLHPHQRTMSPPDFNPPAFGDGSEYEIPEPPENWWFD